MIKVIYITILLILISCKEEVSLLPEKNQEQTSYIKIQLQNNLSMFIVKKDSCLRIQLGGENKNLQETYVFDRVGKLKELQLESSLGKTLTTYTYNLKNQLDQEISYVGNETGYWETYSTINYTYINDFESIATEVSNDNTNKVTKYLKTHSNSGIVEKVRKFENGKILNESIKKYDTSNKLFYEAKSRDDVSKSIYNENYFYYNNTVSIEKIEYYAGTKSNYKLFGSGIKRIFYSKEGIPSKMTFERISGGEISNDTFKCRYYFCD